LIDKTFRGGAYLQLALSRLYAYFGARGISTSLDGPTRIDKLAQKNASKPGDKIIIQPADIKSFFDMIPHDDI